jgi:hypothetical protein
MDYAGSANVNGTQMSHPGTLRFLTASAERMRIDASGNVLVGTTATINAAQFTVNKATNNRFNLAVDGVEKFGVFTDAGIAALYAGSGIPLTFFAGGSERMRINTSGNVGIGTTNPSPYAGYVTLAVGGSTGGALDFVSSAVGVNFNRVGQISAATGGAMSFATGAGDTLAERMRIDASGNLLVGTTSTSVYNSASAAGHVLEANGTVQHSRSGFAALLLNRTTSDGSIVEFFRDGSVVGTIGVTTTATTYNTSSDYRLKNIDGPIANSGAYIDALNPVQGSWKADGSRFIGLLAHEVQEVSETPIATGEKDGEEMQAMDYSAPELIANLIAEIQSMRLRLTQLEGN